MRAGHVARKPRFTTLLEQYEDDLSARVQRGEIKRVTKDTYLNDANRVLEALVFAVNEKSIKKAMGKYGYKGYYGNIIHDLRQIVKKRRRLK